MQVINWSGDSGDGVCIRGSYPQTLFRAMTRKDPNAQQKEGNSFLGDVLTNAGNIVADDAIKEINGETIDMLTGGLKRLGTAGRVSAAAVKFAAESIQDAFLDESRELIQDNEGTTVGELIKDLAEGAFEGLMVGGTVGIVAGPPGWVAGGLAVGLGALSGASKDRLSEGGPAAVIEQYLESERAKNWGLNLHREAEQQEAHFYARIGKSRLTRRPAITRPQTEDSQQEELDLEQESPRVNRRSRINRQTRRGVEVTVEETINNQQAEAQQQGNTELQEVLFRQNQERQGNINQEQDQRNESAARGRVGNDGVVSYLDKDGQLHTFEREIDSEGNPTGRFKETVRKPIKGEDDESASWEVVSEEMITDGDNDGDGIPNSKDSDYVPPKEEPTEPKEQEEPEPDSPSDDDDDWDEEKRPNPANEDQGDPDANSDSPLRDVDADIDHGPFHEEGGDLITGYELLMEWNGKIDGDPIGELQHDADAVGRFDWLVKIDPVTNWGPDGNQSDDPVNNDIISHIEGINPRFMDSLGTMMESKDLGSAVIGVDLHSDNQISIAAFADI